jgi:hypothetical protein
MRRVEVGDNDSPYTSQGPDVLPVLEYLDVVFFDTDRVRTALPRRARFNSDEALIKFAQRADGIRMSGDRQILDMMIRRKTGEITLNLTDSSTRRWN